MSSQKISQLPQVTLTSDSDLYPLVQTGYNYSITFAKLQNSIASALTPSQLPTITLTGNVTGSASGGTIATAIANSAVTNSMLANMANNTVKGNKSGSSSSPSDLSLGNVSESISDVLIIIGGSAAVIGSGLTIEVQQASGSQNGYLSSANWTTFNNTATVVAGATNGILNTGTSLVPVYGYTANTVAEGNDARLFTENLVKVKLNPGYNEFSSVAAAIASITTATSSNPFMVLVGPGVFTEPQIVMKPYVYVVGAGYDSTIITPSNPSVHLIVGSDSSGILSCELTGVTGSGQALVYHNSTTGNSQQAFWIENVRFGASDTLVISSGNNTGISSVSINACRFGSTYSFKTGFYATSTGTNYGKIEIRDTTTTGMQTPYPDDVFLADETNCQIVINGVQCRSGGTTTGNCIRVRNGAILRILGLDIKGFGTGLFIENVGAGPQISFSGGIFENNTVDLNIANSGTIGTIQASATLTTSTIVAGLSNFALSLLDTITGDINTSNSVNIEQLDGTFTDATTISLEAGTMGVVTGGVISIVSGLEINVTSGYGYLDTTPVYGGSVHKLMWPSTNITLATNTNNYIYFDQTGTLNANSNFPDTVVYILLGRVVTNSTGVEFIDASPMVMHHYSNLNDNFNREAIGPIFSYGCQVTENVTPLHLDATEGSYFFGNNNFLPSAETNIVFQTFYRDGGSGWTIGSTNTVDTNYYDDGSGTLQPIPSGYYARHTFYLVGQGANQQYMFVYAQTTYSSLVLAQAGNIPNPPYYFDDGVVLLASIIVKQGSTSIVAGGGQIVDNRPRIGFALPAVEAVGTVTSVALTLPASVFSVSGSPINSSGTLAGNLNTQNSNTVWAGPSSGSAATPTFRTLVGADLPYPSASALGGIQSISPVTHRWIDSISTLGVPSLSQPAFSDISGQTTLAQLPSIAGETVLANATGSTATPTAVALGTVTESTSSVLTLTGWANATIGSPTIQVKQASGSQSGYLSSTDWNTFNNKLTSTLASSEIFVGNGSNVATAVSLSGDATLSNTGALTLNTVNANVGTFASVTVNGKGLVTAASALSGDASTSGSIVTLATVNSNIGSFGSSTSIPSFTVNAKGLITAASGNTVIAPAGTLSGATLNSTVVNSSLTSVGTISSGAWQGTAIGTTYGGLGGNFSSSTGALSISSGTVTAGTLPISDGGTNATTVSGARTNLGIGSGSSFIISGTTYTTPSSITSSTQFKFTLVGGGGGGGGSNTANQTGSGGGGAGVCIVYLTGLSPSTGYTIAIGSAGSGGISNTTPATAGTNTTLTVDATTYTASGGGAGSSTGSSNNGGTGGSATNGTINISGQNGDGNAATNNNPGGGGGSAGMGFGMGGAARNSNTTGAGFNGTGYGAGGGGASNAGGQTGGAGTQGCILVEYWN